MEYLILVMLLQAGQPTEASATPEVGAGGDVVPAGKAPLASEYGDGTQTHMLDYAPAPGWTVHVAKDGRLYYCK